MDTHRWMVFAGCLTLLALVAGCVSEEVVYVDERGNELAVDDEGQPLAPPAGTYEGPTGAPLMAPPTESIATEQPAAPPAARVVRPAPAPSHTDAGSGMPKPDPNWDLPPAGRAKGSPLESTPSDPIWKSPRDLPAKQAPAPKTPAKPPAKKVESSSGLDLPPAG